MIEVQQGSLVVSGSPLHLDARRRTSLCVVSHAHADHIARHAHTLATPETLALMEHRLGPLERTTALAFRAPLELACGYQIELFPAGHVLGAAQVRVTRPDGRRLVYSGDVCLSASRTAVAGEMLEADVLVLEATYGHPRYVFPPREEVYDDVAAWARGIIGSGRRPVLVAYSLGKSQETIAQLNARGLRVVADDSIYGIAQVYSRCGVALEVRRFDGRVERDEVCLFPPRGAREALAGHGPLVVAALTGWALEPWGARRSGADLAFPLSDHADYTQLMKYVEASKAKEVVTVYGYADELAVRLRKRGFLARALREAIQMSLPL